MMDDYVETDVRIDRICRSKFDLITRFHDELISNKFLMPSNIDDYISGLMLCEAPKDETIAPNILSIGSNSIQRDIFGNTWANSILNYKKTPDDKLESRASRGYQEAALEGYHLSLFEGIIHTEKGPKLTAYAKYVTAMNFPNGFKLYVVAGVLQDLQLQ